MSKKTARQQQITAKKKYNKARQKLNTTKNKYSDVLAEENKRFEEGQQYFKDEVSSSYVKRTEEVFRNLKNRWEELEKELGADEEKEAKRLQFINRISNDLEGLARVSPIGRALSSLQDKVNTKFSGIIFEAATLKERYLNYLERFNVLIEKFPTYQQILNEVDGMLPLKFFFVYNKLSSQFKIENLGETFGSDSHKIIKGDDDDEVITTLTENIYQLYDEIRNPDLTDAQLADIEAMEKKHS